MDTNFLKSLQFRQKFIDEATDLVSSLENHILELEKNPDNQTIIEAVFRVMHTLKGSSGMFGYEKISEITHQLENIFDKIRNGQVLVNDEILNLTLATGDHVLNILKDENLEDEINSQKHIELLDLITEITSKNSSDVTTTKDEHKAEKKELNTYYIVFRPHHEMLERGVSIINLMRDLSELGKFQVVTHKFTDLHNTKEPENDAFGIFLVSNCTIEDIEDVFLFEMEDCSIYKFSESNIFEENPDLNEINTAKQIEMTDNQDSLYEFVINQSKPDKKTEPFNEIINIYAKEKQTNNNNANEHEVENIDTNIKLKTELGKQVSSRIYVPSEKLDNLIHLVSELVITNASLNLAIEKKDFEKLIIAGKKVDKLSKQFRDNALNIRLVPVGDLTTKYRRLIRDLSHNLGKKINLITEGDDTELDKNLVDILSEPVMHLIRNSIDHGIESPETRKLKGKPETGVIKFSAYNSGTNVYIKISDDGTGIDSEKVYNKAVEKGYIKKGGTLSQKEIYDLIFLPGFSTAQVLTEVSGRGVGMDVVKRKINELHGDIEIDSKKGEGTTMTMKFPLTISIIDSLMVKIDKTVFLIPLDVVESCISTSQLSKNMIGKEQIVYKNELIPTVNLRNELKMTTERPAEERLVIIKSMEKKYAIQVDKVIGEHQAVVKPLNQLHRNQEYLSGASILGDGSLALILDTNNLIRTKKEILV